VPGFVLRTRLDEAGLLRRIVRYELVQASETVEWPRLFERLEKAPILRQEVAGEALLLVGDFAQRLVRDREHLVGVLDPGRVLRHLEQLLAEEHSQDHEENEGSRNRDGEAARSCVRWSSAVNLPSERPSSEPDSKFMPRVALVSWGDYRVLRLPTDSGNLRNKSLSDEHLAPLSPYPDATGAFH